MGIAEIALVTVTWGLTCGLAYSLGKNRVRRDVARAIRDVAKERGYNWGKLPPPKE